MVRAPVVTAGASVPGDVNMAESFKVAVFDTIEAADAFRAEARAALRSPEAAPIAIDGKFVVKVYGGPAVARQRLAVLRDGALVGL